MNKKFFISWAIVFVVWMAGGFVVHGVLLADGYASLPNLFRSDEDSQQYFHFMLIAHIIIAGSFVWIYQRGLGEDPWLMQGLRYGIAIALLGPIPTYMIYYAVQPMPGNQVVMQIVYDGLLVVILGVVVAFLNQKKAS